MFEGLGFYILFLFKLCLTGVLSLIINYLYKEDNEDSKTLRTYSVLSLIVVALVSIPNLIAMFFLRKEMKLLSDEFPEPGSAKNRKNNAPENGKTTLLEVENA